MNELFPLIALGLLSGNGGNNAAQAMLLASNSIPQNARAVLAINQAQEQERRDDNLAQELVGIFEGFVQATNLSEDVLRTNFRTVAGILSADQIHAITRPKPVPDPEPILDPVPRPEPPIEVESRLLARSKAANGGDKKDAPDGNRKVSVAEQVAVSSNKK